MRQKTIDLSKCTGCKNCELACLVAHTPEENLQQLYQDGGAAAIRSRCRVTLTDEGERLPQHCMHCEDPQCLQACMSGALDRDGKGYVVCDTDTCVGCYMCVMSCPHGAALPALSGKRTLVKCDGCSGRESMACVAGCPTGCLTEGELNGTGEIVTYIYEPATGGRRT